MNFSGVEVFDFLRRACSLAIPHKKPFKFNRTSAIFTNTPCKPTCLYNAPSMHTVEWVAYIGRSAVNCIEFNPVKSSILATCGSDGEVNVLTLVVMPKSPESKILAKVFADMSAVPKRGCSKRSRTQKHANARKRAQMSAKERKRKSARERKRAQKSAKERFRVKSANSQVWNNQVKWEFPNMGEKCGEKMAKCSADFRPSISRKRGRKKFHKKLATNSAGREIKLLHRETLGVWGHNLVAWLDLLGRRTRNS